MWVEGQLARPERGTELAEAWLGALLELPGDDMEALVRSAVEAMAARPDDEGVRRFRDDVAMAMSRFHTPQLLRLRETFNTAATKIGAEIAW
jgi:hypothetical protein